MGVALFFFRCIKILFLSQTGLSFFQPLLWGAIILKISYDELRRIYRLEKNASKLVEVPEDFYNSLNEFVREEKKAYLDSLKDWSSNKSKDFSNLKKTVESLYALREKKLLNLALLHTGGSNEPPSGMAQQERELFNRLLNSLNAHHQLLEELFSNHAQERAQELTHLRVRISGDLESFMGDDLKEYGPFKQNQVVSLPYKVAKVLVARSLAEANDA